MAKKQVAKTGKTKDPSGLSITRTDNKFAFEWKIDDTNYDKGQQVYYKTNLSKKWIQISDVGKKTTSKAITLTMSNYFPSTSKKLTTVSFRVRGKRKPETKETSKEIITTTYGWSGWSRKDYEVKIPNTPTATATLSESAYNSTTFAWNVDTEDTWFTDVVYQSILVDNCNSIGDKQKWSRSAQGWATASGQSASGSVSKSETLGTVSKTRFYRFKARGPAGETGWKYVKHVYAQPKAADIVSTTVKRNAGGYQVIMKWKLANTKANPVDKTVIQYAIATPTTGNTCPVGATWTDALLVSDTDKKTSASFVINPAISTDQALFLRIMSEHDPYDTSRAYTTAVTDKLFVGSLATPSNLTVTHTSGRNYTVSATNNSTVTGSYLVVGTIGKGKSKVTRKATIAAGSTSTTIKVKTTDAFSVVVFAESTGNGVTMTSDQVKWDSGSLPTAPTGLTATNQGAGTVLLTWTNTWDDMTGTEVTYAQDSDAWESTTDPQNYTVKDENTRLFVNNLTVGQWYFRARSIGDDGEVSPWTRTASINLATKPATPVLSASAGKIGLNGTVTLSWTYDCADGTSQAYAEIAHEVVQNNATYYYQIASAETAHSAILYAEQIGWAAGTHTVHVRVYSESGRVSDWSAPIVITVVGGPTAAISFVNLSNVTVTEDTGVTRTALSLTSMPLTITVTGADAGGTTTVAVERAESYHMDRPNGDVFDGFDGETVALVRQAGDAQISITNDDLIGRLDDGAKYRIVATVTDTFGQTSEVRRAFEVHWSQQAKIPSATIVIDNSNLIAKITPVKPTGAANTDVCDIYRLSADKPELIYEGAAWGTTYVDPYPTLGDYGGHRIVLRTANGDYITADNQPAWRDYDYTDDDVVETEWPATVIDFDGDRAILQWNMDISSKWTKDFLETKYLGGAVQGDWNAAVSRTGTITAVVLPAEDPELIRVMRRLADHAGVCHVRTPDGSSFAADVQVSETSGAKIVQFDLSITRVDPEGYDGMTLAQYEEEAED